MIMSYTTMSVRTCVSLSWHSVNKISNHISSSSAILYRSFLPLPPLPRAERILGITIHIAILWKCCRQKTFQSHVSHFIVRRYWPCRGDGPHVRLWLCIHPHAERAKFYGFIFMMMATLMMAHYYQQQVCANWISETENNEEKKLMTQQMPNKNIRPLASSSYACVRFQQLNSNA